MQQAHAHHLAVEFAVHLAILEGEVFSIAQLRRYQCCAYWYGTISKNKTSENIIRISIVILPNTT